MNGSDPVKGQKFQAMMGMHKIVIQDLEDAYNS
jgi:hypothetical protein